MKTARGRRLTEKFMTPQQAAEKWGISRRTVRQYLDGGRIPGIIKMNGRTLIPSNAQKPNDLRTRKNRSSYSDSAADPFVLTTSAFEPGQAEEYIKSVGSETKQTIGFAELSYLRGEPLRACELCKNLNSNGSTEIRLAALLIDLLSSLLKSEGAAPFNNFRDLQTIAKIAAEHPKYKKTGELFGLYLNIIVNNRGDIVFPETGIDAFAMPGGLKPMAVYAYSRWLMLQENNGRAIGLAEGALIFMRDIYPIQSIYLSLTIADGYIISGNWEKAEYYFRYAWSLAKPDGIIAPFAEFRYMLSGLLEKCLRKDEPDIYKKILDLSTVYLKNWISIHNILTGDTVTSKLSPTEFNVAMLAARGMPNSDIADRINISVNSVRTHLRNIFNKLGVNSRKELLDFVIH